MLSKAVNHNYYLDDSTIAVVTANAQAIADFKTALDAAGISRKLVHRVAQVLSEASSNVVKDC